MRILFSCLEPSGLLFAGLVEQELRRLRPDAQVMSFPGSGPVEPVFGFWEGVKARPGMRRLRGRALRLVRDFGPDTVVPVGFPGFNLSFGARCRRLGIQVLYLAPPQVWAWGRFRIPRLREAADKVVCLFPSEGRMLGEAGVDAVFLGNPLVDVVRGSESRARVLARLGLGPDVRYVALLPGSRPNEVAFHGPLFKRMLRPLWDRLGLKGVLVRYRAAKASDENKARDMTASFRAERYETIRHAECAVVVSGTATLETALLGTPQIVCYHLSPMSRLLARLLVRRKTFSLPNILLEKKSEVMSPKDEVCPSASIPGTSEQAVAELLEPTAERLLVEIEKLKRNPASRGEAEERSLRLRELLGPEGASRRIAELVLERGYHPSRVSRPDEGRFD